MMRGTIAVAAGVLAAGLTLGVAVWSDDREVATRRHEIEGETRIVARLFAIRIEGGLQKYLTALQQISNFYAISRKVSEGEFRSFAATTLRMNSSCLNVAFVDATYHVRRVHPPRDERLLTGLDIRAHSIGYATILRAKRAGGPVISPPLELIRGPRGFEIAVPIWSSGTFQGALVGACSADRYFASMLLAEMSERYEHRVLDSGVPIFASAGFDPKERTPTGVSETFQVGGASWEVQVRPQASVMLGRVKSGRTAFWTMAWLLAVSSGTLVCAGALWATRMSASLRKERAALLEARNRLDGTREQLLQAEKMTALGRLVAGVAHEMNNPLAGIVGYTQLLMREKLPTGVRKRVATIASEAARMTKIVRSLLTFARRHTPEKTLVGLNGIIEKTLDIMANQFRVDGITVVKNLSPELPLALMDFHQIQQVLINLLSNAQQAISSAGRPGTIRLTTRCADDSLELRVADDGPGIPLEIRNRVFEPFFTTKQDGKGTGLGLSLCYGVIQEHGGTIRVESESGKGATFVVSLPAPPPSADTARPPAPIAAQRVPSLRILVVDDEPSVRDVLLHLLTQSGHRVDTASDVPEALAKIDTGRHDLVITDLIMPHGSGRDVYQAVLQKDPKLARRVLFITGHQCGDATQQFFRESGSPLIGKPFTLEEIERAIGDAVRN